MMSLASVFRYYYYFFGLYVIQILELKNVSIDNTF